MPTTPGRVVRVTLMAALFAAGVAVLALAVGVGHVDFGRALADAGSSDREILSERLGRVLLGMTVGAALAPAGVAFQALLRNPLADPYVLGVSGGATVTGTLAIVLGAGATWLGDFALPACAFAGALGAIFVVLQFGRVRGRLVPNVALLAGVVVNALAAALTVAIRLIAAPNAAHQALYWLTGSLERIEASRLVALVVYVAIGLVALWALAVPMNAFALGEEAAHTVGVPVERARLYTFFAASLLTGAAVAFAGPIGFVGIVVPHVLRGLLGPDHRVLLPAAALTGGAFLVIADLAARLCYLWLGTEPTVGVLTALVGGPFFLFVLKSRGGDRVF